MPHDGDVIAESTHDQLFPPGCTAARLSFPGCADVDLRPEIDALASRLSRLSAEPRSRVAILHEPGESRQALVAYLAVIRAGLTPGLLRPGWAEGIGHYLENHSFVAMIAGEGPAARPVAPGPDGPDHRQEDFIVFTSGTTARPKGVRFSADGMLHNLDATQSYLRLSDSDHVALPLPIYYVYGLSTLNLALRVGAAVTFLDYRRPPIAWLGSMIEAQPTVVALLPYQARLLLGSQAFCGRRLPAVRALTLAGGPLAPVFTQQLTERFPAAEVFLMYGQTEAGPRASFVPPSELPRHANSIGKGIPGYTRLRVTDSTMGAVSEVQVASRSLMLGYLDAEDQSPITADGWLSTGDLAKVDQDGFVVLVGRCAPFFKVFDERVSFREILDVAEEVIPGASFRLDTERDPLRGETVVLTAFVAADAVVRSTSDNERAFRTRLGTGRAPSRVVVERRTDTRKVE